MRSSLPEDADAPGHWLIVWSKDSPDARTVVLAQGPRPWRTNRHRSDGEPAGRFSLADGTTAELLVDGRRLTWVLRWRHAATGLHLRLQSTVADPAFGPHGVADGLAFASSLG